MSTFGGGGPSCSHVEPPHQGKGRCSRITREIHQSVLQGLRSVGLGGWIKLIFQDGAKDGLRNKDRCVKMKKMLNLNLGPWDGVAG